MTSREIAQPERTAKKKGKFTRQPFRLSRLPLVWRLALLYLPAIVLAEALTILVQSWLGVALHGLILITLLLHAAVGSRRIRRFLLALAMAPLIRLASLALPLQNLPLVYWYLLVGVPLLLATFYAARAGGLSRKMIGLTGRKLPFQVLVALTGIGLGYIEYQILRPEPLIAGLRWELIWLPALILLVFTGLLEELIFRGMLQYTSLPNLGRAGLVYTAVVFTVLHLGYRSWLDLVFVFGVALFFGWAVQRSGSILGATLSHGLINIGLFLIFPFLLAVPAGPVTGPQVAEPGVQVTEEQVAEPVAPVMLAPVEKVSTPMSILSLPLLFAAPSTSPAPASETAMVNLTAAPTATPCGPPPGWVQYQVQPGERMITLSQKFGVSRAELRLANCLDSNRISAGQFLWVPSSPATPTSVPTRWVWPTLTPPPPIPTDTRVPTDIPTLLPEPTQPPPATEPPPATDTPPVAQPTNTPRPTPTPAPTEPPPATDTPPVVQPTDTPWPTPTPAPTETPPATDAPASLKRFTDFNQEMTAGFGVKDQKSYPQIRLCFHKKWVKYM